MNTETRKRLEEAANKYINNHSNYLCSAFLKDRLKEAYAAGAEYGYKEAIKIATEWLKENTTDTVGNVVCNKHHGYQEDFIKDFEADMNKLWEEKK